MPISSSSSPKPRSPLFMVRVRGTMGEATFGSAQTYSAGRQRIVPFFERTGGDSDIDAPPGMDALAPPLPPPPLHPGPEFAARLAQAIGDLRLQSEQLGDQAQADVVEMAVIIARRILEMELSISTTPLFSLVRSAIGRLGESRKISVRLCPTDAAAVEAAGEASPLSGLPIARVEVMHDSSLGPGDCIVDGEHGTVDGRLSSRLDEVRRILTSALAEPGETP